MNGDGIKDLAVFNNASSNVSILLGSASGKFSDPAGNGSFSTGVGPEHGVLVDFDLDGTLDVMTANFTAGTLTFLHGNGDGTFAAARTISVPTGVKPNWIAADDFNKDGQRDLAVTDYRPALASGQIVILLGNGQ